MSQDNLYNLLQHTRSVFEINNLNPNLLDNIQTFEEYKNIIEITFGWDSEQTLYLFEGYFRKNERSVDHIKIVK
jgi:hypothetical protein